MMLRYTIIPVTPLRQNVSLVWCDEALQAVATDPVDQFWLGDLPAPSKMFGLPHADAFTPTRWLLDGDSVAVGNFTRKTHHGPGHTPGHGPRSTFGRAPQVNPHMGGT